MRISPVRIPSSRLKLLLILLFTTTTFYLLNHHLHHHCPPSIPSDLFIHQSLSSPSTTPTTLRHLLFSIASSTSSLPRRLPFLSLWYSPNSTRAFLFLDKRPLPHSLPPLPFLISSNTSHFPYSFPRGHRSAIRVARIVKEAVDNTSDTDVRWFVFGDDDTVFVPENLVSVLAKYDHEKWYYIGGISESLEQNLKMSFGVAYGGGGFAISTPLAKALSKVLDSCLMRYPHLYGSDHRISSCVYELGVELTREPGFHQLDVRGDLFGLLTTHPLSPLLSLHHLEIVEPIFPHKNRTEAVQHLFKAVRADPGRTLQQTVCYDHSSNLTVSVAWGYAVQVFEGHLLLPDILASQRTFTPWRRRGINIPSQYVFDTREYPRDPCKRPVVFFLEDVASGTGRIWSKYKRNITRSCSQRDAIENLKDIRVFAKKLQDNNGKALAPRRECCDIIHPFKKSMVIDIRHCGVNELIAMDV